MNADDVINVCFHGVGTPRRLLEPGEDAYWVDVDRFLRLLDEIACWPSARITFDDSNASDIGISLPALLERSLSAKFFVIAGRLDTPGSLRSRDLRELSDHGMVIGNHGMHHRPWRSMCPTTRQAELVEARDLIADAAAAPVYYAACPLGSYDRRLLTGLRQLGYTQVYTSDRRVARVGDWLQPRYSIQHDDTPESLRDRVLAPRHRHRILHGAVGLVKRCR